MNLTSLHDRMRIGVSILLLLACTRVAYADNYQLGPLPTFPQAYNFLVTHAPGNFEDYFYFYVGPQQSVSSNTAVSLNLRFNPSLNYHISGLNIALYDLSNSFYGVANGIGDPQEAFLEQALLPGAYYAAVSGLANGSAGGTYAYSISAIPEADKWLLMLMGFAAVSFMTFHRRRQ